MAKNTKNWISWERNITFLWNKKILNQCLRWYILRTYHFVEEVSFNSRRTILASSLDYLCWGGIINNFTLFIYIYISIYTYYFYIYIYYIYILYIIHLQICQKNATVRLPHPWSRDSQCQETFSTPSTDNKQTCNYYTEYYIWIRRQKELNT